MFTFNHFNFNVLDLDRSLSFYESALGLKPVREKAADDGSFRLVYLGDGVSDFTLELTWLRDRTEPYNLGECEFHLAFKADDYDAAHAKHAELGCICYENPSMGIYTTWLKIRLSRASKGLSSKVSAPTSRAWSVAVGTLFPPSLVL